jgi:predicted Zn-dependent protease
MRIFTQLNPYGSLGQAGAMHPGQKPLSHILAPSPQSPLDALAALEQWRAQEEDTRKHSARWPLAKCPLKVRIDAHPDQQAGDAINFSNAQALFGAMRQWEAATQGAIRFVLLNSPAHLADEADIIMTWDAQTTLGRDYEVGHTRREVQGKRLSRATITLITQPLIDGHLTPQQRKQRLYTTVLHETGHALGLEHSDYPRDVMYYRGWQRPFLSENDIQRIQSLYALR